jgi:quercetin dioxygenase-like cupin family protein
VIEHDEESVSAAARELPPAGSGGLGWDADRQFPPLLVKYRIARSSGKVGPDVHERCQSLNRNDRHRLPTTFRGAEDMDVLRRDSRPTTEGPAPQFTGKVQIETLFQAAPPGRARAFSVTFEPGARNAWHTHPGGQALIVTAGEGVVQSWGGPAEHIHPGDVVYCPPGEKHWHGASPDRSMTHIAIQEAIDGKDLAWAEEVSDAQYRAGAEGTSARLEDTSGRNR